ncbi:hypothetical protein A2572_04940 [Candidatus Collierbacteria bacterium RIFOXYD1_FULL_40_9]|uniref:Uncharacterized protein n=1 Tax=Candidatus Collierbacteria bacterium RIFOXYD1_FULL_40_9 TaxID=1817731 RepID=A0A1F5FV12_9BACT|nr:MAG: hypothetical protein A2572_04940 [Candidatus Collierbacteria bacterium RIFOXYD1_FULL_40_9]
MDLNFDKKFNLKLVAVENVKELKLVGEKNRERRLAYMSGFYFSLILALYYEEAGRPRLSDDFKIYVVNYQTPPPSSVELASAISEKSYGKILLDTKFIPNPGLRYGLYGHLYAKGIRDSYDLCMDIIPNLIMDLTGGENRSTVLEWISREMNELNPIPDSLKIKYVNT